MATILQSGASLVLTDKSLRAEVQVRPGQLICFVDNPRLEFVKLMWDFVVETTPTFVKPPRGCYVGPGVHIEEGCTFGDNVRLVGNIYIYSNTRIGSNVVIKPAAVIGGQGFGNMLDEKGRLLHFPHIGGVIIEDDVRIGSGTCVDRGVLGDTVIKQGACIDNLVHVAHNVRIGRQVRVIANVMIGGSTVIGDNSWLAPSTDLKDGLTIGNNAVTGMSSCVVRDVPESTLVYGVPAKAKT
ncbi:MAG: hypothetical protein KAT58_10235 [candidate division Zixibacteria bacterium]|nr:hypothetical protein [candidate division Zixibacteria bacterium]